MPEKKGPRPDRFIWHEGDLRILQCMYCRWKRSSGPSCEAFLSGIPMEILRNEFDHTQPHPDDNGLRFERRDDL